MCTFMAAVAAAFLFPSPAVAWGYEGHAIVAAIARAELTPTARAKVDAMLAADPDTLTRPDMLSRATWADAWRSAGHRETAQWHFVDTELDHPDLDGACFHHPAPDKPASAGPAADCVVDKVDEFRNELADPATSSAERLLALKYLLHFVGDLHQPLHASDNHDHGGNCVIVSLGGARTVNLHAYWDTVIVETLGSDPEQVAARLAALITPMQRRTWERGTPADWSREAFQVARATTYTIGSPPGCPSDPAPIALPPSYEEKARKAAALQLERAGVRLAAVLNEALASLPIIPPALPGTTASTVRVSAAPVQDDPGRSAASLACSTEADAQGLHGKVRQRFRRRCIRQHRGS